MVAFEFETEGDFVPGSTTEWDVFQMLPGDDAPVYLATLYNAQEKAIRPELKGCGSGSFAINRSAPECTEANLAQGNLVKVRIPEIHDDYIFAFFLETGDFTLISSQEAGGEMLTFGGRGILSYLEYARAWSESYIDGGDDPIAGVWRAYNAGTGSAPGQILRRMLEEFQDPDRPQFPIPHLTIDFDYDDDSTGDPWDTTDATDEFSYQVGEDGLAILLRLLETETITVQMDPDFTLHAYNIDNYGRDLAGDAFGAGVVRFEREINIATELRRELGSGGDMMGGGSGLADTHILVQGEADAYGTADLSDAADRVTKEAFLAAFGTGTTALSGIGLVELNTRLGRSDTIMFPIANRRTADVVLSDPVSVGGTLGEDALTGFYLPGPEGTLGDFWVGDTVRVHTGSDAFDYDEVNAVVQAISIVREDDNHELMVIPELRTQPTPVLCEGDQSQDFSGMQTFDVFMYEISGVQSTPVDSDILEHQTFGTVPYQTPALTPGNGTSSILIAGWIFDNEGDTAPGVTSSQLTAIDADHPNGANPGSSPETVVGHLLIPNASGAYSPDVVSTPSPFNTYGEDRRWACAAAVFLSNGGTPTVVQTASAISTGDAATATFASPPTEGNLIVVFLSARNTPGNLDSVSPGFTKMAQMSSLPSGAVIRYGRMMYKEVCADG